MERNRTTNLYAAKHRNRRRDQEPPFHFGLFRVHCVIAIQSYNGSRSRTDLLPVLGVFTTTMIVVGGVIGSGIFRIPGVMSAQLGSPTLLLAVWVLAGVFTLFGALTN